MKSIIKTYLQVSYLLIGLPSFQGVNLIWLAALLDASALASPFNALRTTRAAIEEYWM